MVDVWLKERGTTPGQNRGERRAVEDNMAL